jgi:mannitol-1-/sugar-/sorbitol-6-/2-deoxyglucose-6-phosphatase
MIKNVIFDMDGLLIDSEPLWEIAQIEVYARLGFNLDAAFFNPFKGFRSHEAVEALYHKLKWEKYSVDEVCQQINNEVGHLLRTRMQPKPGAEDILQYFKAKGFKIGLASSLYTRLIKDAFDRTGFEKYFDVVHSGEFEAYGKPHPAVYLTALELMGCDANEAIVFEDSLNGMIAAKAARIRTIAVPDRNPVDSPKYGFTDLQLSSLTEFSDEHLIYLNKL